MLKSIPGVLALLSTVLPAQAQDTVLWQENVAGWQVNVDRTIGDSCFMSAAFDTGAVVRFQFNARQGNIQFIIGDLRWASVLEGETYDLEVTFGDLAPWSGEAVGHRWSDILPSLVLSVPAEDNRAADFIGEFATTAEVRVAFDGREIAQLSLVGSGDAVAEMFACQREMAASGTPVDPFSGSTSGSTLH
jgi:hypothetical protein